MTGRITPTQPQLQLAFERRRRPHWPDTLQATLRHPVLATLVQCDAVRHIVIQQRRAAASAARAAHALATRFDPKRAAAGDLAD